MYMNHVSSQNKDRGATFSSYVKMMVSSESLYTLYWRIYVYYKLIYYK